MDKVPHGRFWLELTTKMYRHIVIHFEVRLAQELSVVYELRRVNPNRRPISKKSEPQYELQGHACCTVAKSYIELCIMSTIYERPSDCTCYTGLFMHYRADSWLAPSQWETSLQRPSPIRRVASYTYIYIFKWVMISENVSHTNVMDTYLFTQLCVVSSVVCSAVGCASHK